MKPTTFEAELLKSNGIATSNDVTAIIRGNIPGALQVKKTDPADDRSGVDYWVEHIRGRRIGVDLKGRTIDFGLDDLAIETWSVCEKEIVGWSRDDRKRCDFILWIWKDSRRWVMLPFPMLCAVVKEHWEAWREDYGPPKRQRTDCDDGSHYHSECVFVPRLLIGDLIATKFGEGRLPVDAIDAIPEATFPDFLTEPVELFPAWCCKGRSVCGESTNRTSIAGGIG